MKKLLVAVSLIVVILMSSGVFVHVSTTDLMVSETVHNEGRSHYLLERQEAYR